MIVTTIIRKMGIAARLALVASLVPAAAATAGDDPIELKWAQLIPPAATMPPKPPNLFTGAMPPPADGNDPSPPLEEGAWMSLKQRQPGGGIPPMVVAELDSKRVRIGGYVVPLDFNTTSITEFLLVPFVGACIHVPPPPANQIIYVKIERGFGLVGTFDPVKVTGTLKAETAFTGLADAGYSIDAEAVELLNP
jgi:uncharacterized protein